MPTRYTHPGAAHLRHAVEALEETATPTATASSANGRAAASPMQSTTGR
jgi:hypothetical protein